MGITGSTEMVTRVQSSHGIWDRADDLHIPMKTMQGATSAASWKSCLTLASDSPGATLRSYDMLQGLALLLVTEMQILKQTDASTESFLPTQAVSCKGSAERQVYT